MNDDHDLPDDGDETGEHPAAPSWAAAPPPAGPPLDDFGAASGPVQPVHPSVLGGRHDEDEDPNSTAAFEPVAAEPEPAVDEPPAAEPQPAAPPPVSAGPEPVPEEPVPAQPVEPDPVPEEPVAVEPVEPVEPVAVEPVEPVAVEPAPAPATAAAQTPAPAPIPPSEPAAAAQAPAAPAPVAAAAVPATAAARADTGWQAEPIGGPAPGFDFGSPPDGGDGDDDETHPLRYFLIGAALGLVALAAIFGVGLLLLRDTGSDSASRQASTPATPVAPATTTPVKPTTTPKTTTTTATTPPADLSPALAGAKLTTVALGPIRVGMTLDQANAAAGTDLKAEGDTGDAACRAYAPTGGPEGVQVLVASDIVTGFAVSRNTVPTLSGIKVGDTADQVRSTYGDRIQSEPGDGGETLTYVPSNSSDTTRIVFETDANNTVVAMRAGQSSGAGNIDDCG